MPSEIDLHTHTTASDGTMAPAELVRYAKEKGLKAIAVTDHDNIGGLQEAVNEGLRVGLEVIPGVEINCDHLGKELHIVGLFIDYTDEAFIKEIEKLQNARELRNVKVINKLNEMFNSNLTIEELMTFAPGKVIVKGHIMKLILAKGLVASRDEAWDLVKDGGPAYFSKATLNSREAIKLIEDFGGFPILAHPGGDYNLGFDEMKEIILQLKKEGLKGLEVYQSKHDEETTNKYLEVARSQDLVLSGGSDFHGNNSPERDIGMGTVGVDGRGNLNVGYELLEAIKNHRTGAARKG